MLRKGPIVVIEDDEDDQLILQEVFNRLDYPNKLIFFNNGQDALDFLNRGEVLPFLILSDINMPKLDGFALRQKLKSDAALQLKCIPYIFFTTTAEQSSVIDAYSLSAQGFFIKPNSIEAIQKSISAIMEYWMLCAAPNNFA